VNALSGCCLSTYLPSPHRKWAAIELVRTLAYRSKLRIAEQPKEISADFEGKVFPFIDYRIRACGKKPT